MRVANSNGSDQRTMVEFPSHTTKLKNKIRKPAFGCHAEDLTKQVCFSKFHINYKRVSEHKGFVLLSVLQMPM
jgi:hypothetical protein